MEGTSAQVFDQAFNVMQQFRDIVGFFLTPLGMGVYAAFFAALTVVVIGSGRGEWVLGVYMTAGLLVAASLLMFI